MKSGSRALTGLAALLLTAACAGPGEGTEVSIPSSEPAGPTSGPTQTGPPPARWPRIVHVVGLGDSVMAGTHCGCNGLAEEYGKALAAREGVHVRVSNLGVGGKVTDDLLDELRNDRTTRAAISAADVVLVTIGANDLLPELDQWRSGGCTGSCFAEPAARMGRHLAKILAAVVAVRSGRRAVVLVTDYWNVFTDGDVARRTGGEAQVDWSVHVTAAANRQICAATRAAGDICVDLVPVFKPRGADPTPLLASDGDHPDAAGVRAIVRALLAATPEQAERADTQRSG